MAKSKFAVGTQVTFKGYKDEVPEEEQMLTAGETYEIAEVNEEEESLAFQIENPDFNPKKKETDENAKTILVDVFFDEVEAVAAAPAKAKGKAKAAQVEEEEEEEEEEEAPAPKAKAKAAPAKAAPAKGKAKAAPVEEEDDEAEEAPAPKAKGKAAPAAKSTAKVAAKASKGKAVAKAKAKPAKAAAEEEDKYPELEAEDEDILTLIEGADIIELAEELVEDSAALDYKLGGVLYHVRLSKAYQDLDDKYKENGGFGLFLKERLNVDYRKAMYLIDIYFKFNQYGIDAAKVQELGWTKCAKIAAVMTEDNAEELVELAEGSSVSELSDTIKETYHDVGGTKGTKGEKRMKVAFKFRLWDDQAEGVKQVLEQTQTQMGFKDPADAFEHIVMEWAAEHDIEVDAHKAKDKAKGKAAAKAAPAPKAKAGRRVAADA